ncbi:MAG: GntR family transcriptional regulator [Mobilicoccus sp.]|nr:GntR family transcriptional regulator [Mobilicoccus sp.]
MSPESGPVLHSDAAEAITMGTTGRRRPAEMPVLAPIVQSSTSELIAERLREAVASGRFAPGQQLLESALAAAFGVSRGPLREAMQRLTQEGLLVGHRNRGLFVLDLDEPTVRDMYLARGAIEEAATRHLVESGRGADASSLLDIVADMRAHDGPPDGPEVSTLDLRFHEELVALSESPRLIRMHTALVTQVRLCLTTMQATFDDIESRAAEHEEFARAVIAQDADEAIRLLSADMADGLERVLRVVRGEAEGDA